jgi:transposase-like protein
MNEEWCYQTLRRIRWPGGVRCPRCGSGRVTIHTRRTRTPRLKYLCFGCRRTFSDLTDTVFARSNLPLSTWFVGLCLLPQELSTVSYARMLSLKWDTARRLARSLLVAAGRPGLIRELQAVIMNEQRATRTGRRG